MEKRRYCSLFLLFSTIICYLYLDFHVKTGTRISLRDKRLFEISEVEITRVDCTSVSRTTQQNGPSVVREEQRHKSACASMQSALGLVCSSIYCSMSTGLSRLRWLSLMCVRLVIRRLLAGSIPARQFRQHSFVDIDHE